jgi:Phage integrase family
MEVAIPILPELQACLDVAPRNHLSFLVTEYGRPFSPAGFTNRFRDRCTEAGLPMGLSPHGLRKAFCRQGAEAGLTPHQSMAISGHKNLAEVTSYTEAADRARLAKEAMRTIADFRSGKPIRKFSNRSSQPVEKKRKMKRDGGADRDRTGDLSSAIAALSQLSYGPIIRGI